MTLTGGNVLKFLKEVAPKLEQRLELPMKCERLELRRNTMRLVAG